MRYTPKVLYLLALLLFYPLTAFSATVVADSCSLAHVTTAYNAASAGDTVSIPAGECSWTASLDITKSINLIGAGGDTTKLTISGDYQAVSITLSTDVTVRVSGIYFYQATNSNGISAIYVLKSAVDGADLTKVRIDHNKFEKGTRAVYVGRGVEGLIDSNTFINNNIAIGTLGNDNYDWVDAIAAGTANALFIENNTFTHNNDMGREDPNEMVYMQEGTRTVVRYNTMDGTAFTTGSSGTFEYDVHGNQNLYSGSGDFRGSPISEVYNNIMTSYQGYFTADLRSGSHIWFRNTISKTKSGVVPRILFKEEESWTSGAYWCPSPCPADASWPAEDQITNSFFWDNTFNGVTVTDDNYTTYFIYASAQDANFIRKDYEYFLHAPAASGGKSTYPTRLGASDMTFSGSGANAYYPYTPYTCPHPLATELSGKTCSATIAGTSGYGLDSPLSQYTLTLTKTGTGSGTVTSSPAGISCGATCTYDFDASTEVTLTATADYGNAFTGWSGTGGCTGTSTCVLTMSEARAATATFQPRKITFGGSGTITTGGSGTITLQ